MQAGLNCDPTEEVLPSQVFSTKTKVVHHMICNQVIVFKVRTQVKLKLDFIITLFVS